ncbi:MAG TPA: hypothetical protein VHS53_10245 [Mucilaginibacter sp.]|nr:hypothetical protein [Mucilaginibacter sp.]
MKKKLTLILLFSVACIKIFGQNKSSLPDPKSETRLERALDSTGKISLENFRLTGKTDTAIRLNCGCPNQPKALFLVKTHHRTFILDSLSMLNPGWIDDIYIIKKQPEIEQYGHIAKGGIVVIILNDKDHPDAYKEIKQKLRKISPNFNVPKGQSKSTEILIR